MLTQQAVTLAAVIDEKRVRPPNVQAAYVEEWYHV